MKSKDQDQFNELSFYTLSHPDMIYFIHQHIVDAYQAQTADENTKPIALTFSLIGLYLYLEKGYTGRQVQEAHVKLSKHKKTWPLFELPDDRGEITVVHVLAENPGETRDLMIKEWCKSVWKSHRKSHEIIASLVKQELGV
jgi:hypothetical protein